MGNVESSFDLPTVNEERSHISSHGEESSIFSSSATDHGGDVVLSSLSFPSVSSRATRGSGNHHDDDRSSNYCDGDELEVTRTNMLRTMKMARRYCIPFVRMIALLQSIRDAPDAASLDNLFQENLAESPYLSQEVKNELKEAVDTKRWDTVERIARMKDPIVKPSQALSPFPVQSFLWLFTASARRAFLRTRGTGCITDFDQDFESFRLMALLIFASSRKVRKLKPQKRRQLGRLILSLQSKEEVLYQLRSVLRNAETLGREPRRLILDDLSACRYDRLLLPSRLDCERCHRLGPPVLSPEAPAEGPKSDDETEYEA